MYYFTVFFVVLTSTVILSHSHYVKKRTHSEECDDPHHYHYPNSREDIYWTQPIRVPKEVWTRSLPVQGTRNKESISKHDKIPIVIRDYENAANVSKRTSNRNVNRNVNSNVNTIIKKDVNRREHQQYSILPDFKPRTPESKEVDYVHDHIKDDSSQDEDIEGVTISPTPKLIVEIHTTSPEIDGEILFENVPRKYIAKNIRKRPRQQNDQTSTEEPSSKTSQDKIQDISKQQKDDRPSSTEKPRSMPESLSKSQEGEEEIKKEVKPKLHGDDENGYPKKTVESSKEGKKGVGKRRRVKVAVPEDYVEVSVPSSNPKDDKEHETNRPVSKLEPNVNSNNKAKVRPLDEDQEQSVRKNSDLKSPSAPSLRRMKFPKLKGLRRLKAPEWSASDLLMYGLDVARQNNGDKSAPATRILEEERINSPIRPVGPKRAKQNKNLNKNKNVNKNSNRNVNNNRIRPSTSIEFVPENYTDDDDYEQVTPIIINRRTLNKNFNRNVNRNVITNSLRDSAEDRDVLIYPNDFKSNRRALDDNLLSDLIEAVERKNSTRIFNENKKNKNADRNRKVIRTPHSYIPRRVPATQPHKLTKKELESLLKKYQDSERTFENDG